MNILYLSDPHSVHDIKWINYFSDRPENKCYIIPRQGQVANSSTSDYRTEAIQLNAIRDFSIARFFTTLLTALRIKKIIRNYKINVVHILYAEPNALWCLFRGFFGKPMIISTRGTDVLRTIPEVFQRKTLINYLVAFAYKKAFAKADWVTGTSTTQLESVQSFSGRESRVTLVRTGVDMDLIKSIPSGDRRIVGLYVLFPRSIRPAYNHELCLEAISQLPKEIKEKYKMVFLGKNRGDIKYQTLLEKKMDLIKDVSFIFLEKQDPISLVRLYRAASVVVMTPHTDGSPVSAMEAILCGAPVITGPLEYDPEIFSNTTIKLAKWDAKELSDRITDVLVEKIKLTPVSPDVQKLMDRQYNMRMVEEIYKRVCRKC